ncbi:MAG: hypothetical protein F6K55_03135 [Moorea sp. SIO4A3]|nr:hypothetical protein [Moorena sp. SIO4A3]
MLKPDGEPIANKKVVFEAIPYSYSPEAQWTAIPVTVETNEAGDFSVNLQANTEPFPASNYFVKLPDGSPRFVITMPNCDREEVAEARIYELTTLRSLAQVPKDSSVTDLLQQVCNTRYALRESFNLGNPLVNTSGHPMVVPLNTTDTIPYLEARIDERLQGFTGSAPFGTQYVKTTDDYDPSKYDPNDPGYEEGWEQTHPLSNCWVSAAVSENRYQPIGQYYSQADGEINRNERIRLGQKVDGIQYSLNNTYVTNSALNQFKTEITNNLGNIFYNPGASEGSRYPEGAVRYSDGIKAFILRSQLYGTTGTDDGVLRYVDIKANLEKISSLESSQVPLGAVTILEKTQQNQILMDYLHDYIVTKENLPTFIKDLELEEGGVDEPRLRAVEVKSEASAKCLVSAFVDPASITQVKLKTEALPDGVVFNTAIAAPGAGKGLVNVEFLQNKIDGCVQKTTLTKKDSQDTSTPITLDYFNENKGDKNDFTRTQAERLFVPKSEDGATMDVSYLPRTVVQKNEVYNTDEDGNFTVLKFATLSSVETQTIGQLETLHTSITREIEVTKKKINTTVAANKAEVGTLASHLFEDPVEQTKPKFADIKTEALFYKPPGGGEWELDRSRFPYTIDNEIPNAAPSFGFHLLDLSYLHKYIETNLGVRRSQEAVDNPYEAEVLFGDKPFIDGKLQDDFVPDLVVTKEGFYFTRQDGGVTSYTDPKVLTSDHIDGFDLTDPGALKTIKVLADINVVTGVADTDSAKIVNVRYMSRYFPGRTPKLDTTLFPYDLTSADADPSTIADEALITAGYLKNHSGGSGLKLEVRDWNPSEGLKKEDDFVIFRVRGTQEVILPDPPREGFYFELVNMQERGVSIVGDFLGTRTSATLRGGVGESVGFTAITSTEWRIEGRYI